MVNGEKRESCRWQSNALTPCLLLAGYLFLLFSIELLTSQNTYAASHSVHSFTTVPLDVEKTTATGFKRLDAGETGIDFKNLLAGDAFLTDAVAHNGSGLALGDVDGDRLVDIYFCGLQSPNKLFKNLGNWKFQEQEIGTAACSDQRSTGAALVDLDGDADLDLLVNGIATGTRLFLNDGAGRFTESKENGLSQTSSATSMALADIDMDGDLDLYVAHYVDVMYTADPTTQYALARQNGTFVVSHVNGEPTTTPRLRNRFTVSPTGRLQELPEFDALYLNKGDARFKPIQFEKGTFNNQQGRPVMPPRDWSLAVMFRDLNDDDYPDLYVCTDNASPDRVWINNGNGTFRMQEATAIRHTSRSSMGIDFADIDRDGIDDFFVADMFARTHEKRMTQLSKQYSDPQEILHPNGRPRYNRNTLFMGTTDHSFVETALMAGVAASDWSWCPVFLDVDLDGFEDLLVTNGFSFDVMDQDSQDQLRTMQISKHERQRSRQFHPPFVTPNAAFRNIGNGIFEPADGDWGFDINGISNGMALGDLDNDGDQDVVINQLNDQAIVLRNITSQSRIKVTLTGKAPNTMGIGARIQLNQGSKQQSQVIIGGGRYLSGDEACRVFGIPETSDGNNILEVQWPDRSVSRIENIKHNYHYTIHQAAAENPQPTEKPNPLKPLFTDSSHLIGHSTVSQPMQTDSVMPIPFQMDHPINPGLAWQDINEDGWPDLWISAERGQPPAIYINRQGKAFEKHLNFPPAKDDQGTAVGWKDDNGGTFWLVATPHRISHPQRESAIQVFDSKSSEVLRTLSIGKYGIGDLKVADMDGDGDEDLFIATTSPWGRYPEAADCQVWINEQGKLQHSPTWSRAFQSAGVVRAASFFNGDQNGYPDLALATEWGPIRIYLNTGSGFEEQTEELGLASENGWWTDVETGDFNGDGRLDLAATNRGSNTELALIRNTSFRVYYGDADRNKQLEVITTWKSENQWYPLSDRNTLTQLIPDLPQRIPSHHQFSQATINDVLGDSIDQYKWLEALIEESSIFLRTDTGYTRVPLPHQAQQSSAYCIEILNSNEDDHLDLFIGQNHFDQHSAWTRLDNGRGLICLGQGDGTFKVCSADQAGIQSVNQQRHVSVVDVNKDGKKDLSVMLKHKGPALLLGNKP
ncbi:MAG: VCBS repeat-containing protein [Verrucomicrobiota bacterium]